MRIWPKNIGLIIYLRLKVGGKTLNNDYEVSLDMQIVTILENKKMG